MRYRYRVRSNAWRAACSAILALSIGAPVGEITLSVGSDPACSHASLQQAIDTAEAAGETALLRVSRNGSYLAQALTLDTNQRFEIAGGYADCTQTVASGARTVLDGGGGAAASVLRIIARNGGQVILRRLRIQHGDVAGDGAGGGVFFGGSRRFEIHDSDVIGNIAGNGGGIYAGGAESGAHLVIGADVTITGNEARFSGGGVFADGLTLSMLEPDSIIAFNTALGTSDTGYGGGLVVRALDDRPGLARIGSAGSGTMGAISANLARVGGGVAVIGDPGDFGEEEAA